MKHAGKTDAWSRFPLRRRLRSRQLFLARKKPTRWPFVRAVARRTTGKKTVIKLKHMCRRRVSVRTLFGRSVSLVFDPRLRPSSDRARPEEWVGGGVNDFLKIAIIRCAVRVRFRPLGRACRTEFAKPSFVSNVLLAVRTRVLLPVDDIRLVYTALYYHVYLLLYVSWVFSKTCSRSFFTERFGAATMWRVWKHRLHFYSPHLVYCVWVRLTGSFSKRSKCSQLLYDGTIVKIF